MRSIKPGRGPAGMNAFGAVVAVIFGIIWTIAAVSMGAPFFFPLFGIVFVIAGIGQAVYHYHNATSENRFSSFDITDENEEPDPLNRRFGPQSSGTEPPQPEEPDAPGTSAAFCPFCGEKVAGEFEFCPKCGKKLP